MLHYVETPSADPHARCCGEGGQRWPPLPDSLEIGETVPPHSPTLTSVAHDRPSTKRFQSDGSRITNVKTYPSADPSFVECRISVIVRLRAGVLDLQ